MSASIMANDLSPSTGDLRSNSIDYKRHHDHKSKWAHGVVWRQGRSLEGHGAPVKIHPKSHTFERESVVRMTHRAKIASNRDLVDERKSARGTPNKARRTQAARRGGAVLNPPRSEESVAPTAASEPDAEITYSYDASRGPSHGSQLLGMAVEAAVERFENAETEKIVRQEYDLLEAEGLAAPAFASKQKGKKPAQLRKETDIEDEYEFV